MPSTWPASRSPTGARSQFVRDWKKADTQEAAFLHEAHAGACQYFTTVLGPGADVFHYNHIHLDLANHGATNTGPRRICKPTPAPSLLAAARRARRPAAGARDRGAARHRACSAVEGESRDRACADVPDRAARGPERRAAAGRVAETDPAPPILPPGAGPSVDPQPTSSIGDHDE